MAILMQQEEAFAGRGEFAGFRPARGQPAGGACRLEQRNSASLDFRPTNIMDKFKIQGGTPLSGEMRVSGSKNSALPALAACLLTSEPVTLHRIPQVRDISTMQNLLTYTGAKLAARGRNGSSRSHRSSTSPKLLTMW